MCTCVCITAIKEDSTIVVSTIFSMDCIVRRKNFIVVNVFSEPRLPIKKSGLVMDNG